jgi:hypothetical protein
MPVSVTQAVSMAFERMRLVLFQPFDFMKWITIGLAAFLAYLGDSLGNGGGGNSGQNFQGIRDWDAQIAAIAAAVVLLIILITICAIALFSWLSARGRFMLIDCVVCNQGAIVEPWRATRRQGNSFFLFKLVFVFIMVVVMLGIVAGGFALAWPDIEREHFGTGATLALTIGIPLLLVCGIAGALIGAIADDFVAPAMYLRDELVMEGWRTVRTEVLGPHFGDVVRFYLLKILLFIAITAISIAVGFATCCIAFLPYIGTVILLPLFVFRQCYPLCFLQQIGPGWEFFPPSPPPVVDRGPMPPAPPTEPMSPDRA